MLLILSIILIPILTALLPYFVRQIAQRIPNVRFHESLSWLPVLAACLYFAAWFLPDIRISTETTTFQQHFVGGGVFSACLYVYFKQLLGWKLSLGASLIVLFAWVSALGVANELIEFTLTKLQLAHIGTGDTDWDLLANTLGALVGYVWLMLVKVETFKPDTTDSK